MSTTIETAWRELNVYSEGELWGSLGELVDNAPANLDGARIEDGQIAEWQDFLIAAPGEDPDWNTPAGPVDWTLFERSIQAARGQATES